MCLLLTDKRMLGLLLWAGTAVSMLAANKIITTPLPETVEVCIGQDTTICVYATPLVAGDQLRYRWYKDGTVIPGEEGPCLTIRNPQLSDDWSLYEVEVESYYITGGGQTVVTGSERSATTLRVYEPSTIITQPQNWSGCEGRLLTLSVSVSGTGLSFQWYKDGQPVPGASSSTYSTVASQSHNGTWWCLITGPCGSLTTDQVQVTVKELPQITKQPNSAAACVGERVTLSVEATGYAPLNYQWYRNGVPVGTGQSHTFTMDPTTAGEYWATVSNECGQVTSRRVTVVAYLPPQIISQPQGGRWQVGQRIVLRVEATGKLPLNYQWQKDGQDIPGATSNTYVINSATIGDAGRYRCKVRNDCGEVWSNEADVTIEPISAPETATHDGYVLYRIEPMPVTTAATVRFVAPGTAPVRLVLYDLYGRAVATLAEGSIAGEQRLLLSPDRLGIAPGVYSVRLEASGIALSQPLVFLR